MCKINFNTFFFFLPLSVFITVFDSQSAGIYKRLEYEKTTSNAIENIHKIYALFTNRIFVNFPFFGKLFCYEHNFTTNQIFLYRRKRYFSNFDVHIAKFCRSVYRETVKTTKYCRSVFR